MCRALLTGNWGGARNMPARRVEHAARGVDGACHAAVAGVRTGRPWCAADPRPPHTEVGRYRIGGIMHAFMLQDWTTIKAAAGSTTVIQGEDEWLDMSPYQDLVFLARRA